jgi:hypothetical protein
MCQEFSGKAVLVMRLSYCVASCTPKCKEPHMQCQVFHDTGARGIHARAHVIDMVAQRRRHRDDALCLHLQGGVSESTGGARLNRDTALHGIWGV